MPRKKKLSNVFAFDNPKSKNYIPPEQRKDIPAGMWSQDQMSIIKRRVERIEKNTEKKVNSLLRHFQQYVYRKAEGHNVSLSELAYITDISSRQITRILNEESGASGVAFGTVLKLLVMLGSEGPLFRMLALGHRNPEADADKTPDEAPDLKGT